MTTEQHIKLGRLTALISFLLGTAIFGLYFLSSWYQLLFVGYGYVILAGLVNTLIIILLSTRAGKDHTNRNRLTKTAGLMLINIPVLLIYCWVAMILINTMRITFTNDTETILTEINIAGGGGGHIDKLEIGESKTVWVTIKGDGAIHIDYLSNGERKGEMVASYITSSMGQKMKHKIDGVDKDIL